MASTKNEWETCSFAQIEKFIEENKTSGVAFAKALGVSNSSFHNWKRGDGAPNKSTQLRIKQILDGEIPVAESRRGRPKGSGETKALPAQPDRRKAKSEKGKKALAAVMSQNKAAKAAKKTTKKKAGKAKAAKVTKAAKKKTAAKATNKTPAAKKTARRKAKGLQARKPARKKARGMRARTEAPADNSWVNQIVGEYLSHNKIETIDDMTQALSAVQNAIG